MVLAPGTRLGQYVVQAALGAGGMGEVYRARDSKLNRDVALKILKKAVAADHDRLARFQREAQVLAALNHPHIAAIYGVEEANGVQALVLELVEGPTLGDRIAAGRVGLDQALSIGRQIAEALEAAHAHGIIHRDLKPANIKVRTDGVVKVLDFGLAKTLDPEPGGSHLSQSPTATNSAMTGAGVILGTAAYMAPEQATGKPADARADIWAFGVILYEMLTGERGFRGATTLEVLSQVLQADPDWTALPIATPPTIRSLLRRCLQKDPTRRLRDIADARFQIEDALENSGGHPDPRVPARRHTRNQLAWIAALIVGILAGVAGGARYSRTLPPQADEVRLEVNTPPTTDLTSLAISPDARRLAFVASSDGQSRLWIRSLDEVLARPLSATDNAKHPFWSPDSRSIGFSTEGQLKRIDLDSGSVRVLASRGALGGTWNQDGTILFGGGAGLRLFRVSADGGEPVEATQMDQQNPFHRAPQFLPDGRHYLFYVVGSAPGVYVGQLGSSDPPRRIIDAQAGVYASSGHLFFVRANTLFVQTFDPVRLELAGSPTPVAEQIVVRELGEAALSSSPAGPIAYRTGASGEQHQFVWFDRSGKALEFVANSDIGNGYNSSLSPDARYLAIGDRIIGGTSDIWLLDLSRRVPSRFTFDPKFDLTPVWSPDGRRIAFNSDRKGRFDVYVKPVAGAGNEEELLVGAEEYDETPSDWSPDGRFVLYTRLPTGAGVHTDIWAVPLDGDRKAFPVVETRFDEANGQFSPDGGWIAYQSNESGRREIYVQPFPSVGEKRLVSGSGGGQVRWRQDGKELYFLTPDNRLMAVPIRLGPGRASVEIGTPVPLFTTRLAGTPEHFGARHYNVSRDGQRFLVDTLKEVTLPITVVLNWRQKP